MAHKKRRTQQTPAMNPAKLAGFMAGYGRIWPDMAGHGRQASKSTMRNSSAPCPVLSGFVHPTTPDSP